MTVITSPTYDPIPTAQGLAKEYVAPAQAIEDAQTARAQATATGLPALSSALSTFQFALQDLNDGTTSVTANSATFSDSTIGNATASASAVAGTYSFYVQQLATAGQVSYNVNDSAATNAGALNVVLADGTNFQVDLANADSNMDGKLSAKEIAAAINIAAANDSRVTASTQTINGQSTLVLNSTKTGAANAVASIDVSGLGDAGLQSSLSAQTVVAQAQDAIVHVGSKTGTAVQQATNTFSIIDNVKFTITAAQSATASPVTLTVAADNTNTAANVKKFVDAYNTLLTAINSLTAAGDHTATSPTDSTPVKADAAFYNDPGVAALRDRLGAALRAVTGGKSLISFGISANRDGTLALDSARLNKAVAASPGTLDTLFGRAGVGVESGVLGTMDTLLNGWTNASNGFISTRTNTNTKLQSDLKDRQDSIQDQYNSAYKRYLAQFTALQQLQSTMTNNSNLFTALFSSSSS